MGKKWKKEAKKYSVVKVARREKDGEVFTVRQRHDTAVENGVWAKWDTKLVGACVSEKERSTGLVEADGQQGARGREGGLSGGQRRCGAGKDH